MGIKSIRSATAWMLAVALVVAGGAAAWAQDQQSNGRVVRIGPDDQGKGAPTLPPPGSDVAQVPQTPVSPYWIGLIFGPVTPELRAHVELPESQGLLVREIVPDSPAAKGGLKLYDILLRANDAQLREMGDLVELVRTEGEKKGQITLEVFRKGQRQSLIVKPEERPAQFAQASGAAGQGELQGEMGQRTWLDIGQFPPELHRFFERNGGDGRQFEFRQFGPGVIVGGNEAGAANMPNGLSISVRKENDQPARATVKRGNETWEVVGGDPESLEQLPEDIRPSVERMLNGGGTRFNFNTERAIPQMNMPGFDEPGLRKRMEAMERQMQQLLERWPRAADAPAGDREK